MIAVLFVNRRRRVVPLYSTYNNYLGIIRGEVMAWYQLTVI